MRKFIAATLLLFALGCASTTASSTGTAAPDLDVQIEQLPDAGFAVEDRGAVSVAYQMRVRNRLAERITLRKIEMQTLGRSPYTLRNTPAEVSEAIEPGQEAVVTFTMWSYPREQRSTMRQMVWVRGAVHFDSATGTLRKEFSQSFREP